MPLPAFARRHAADHFRAVGNRLFGMEGTLLAGEALADDFGVLVNQDAHSIPMSNIKFNFIGESLEYNLIQGYGKTKRQNRHIQEDTKR